MIRTCFALCILTLTTAVFAGAPDRIPAGFDTWITVGGGATFMSFDEEPIPADFFCAGSEAFTGRIHFEGVPLASEPMGSLGASDTVVERIDDAFFQDGKAMSRIRVKAIHLASRDEIATGCGVWSARVGLAREQPTTTIEYNQVDDFSGTFNAELVLNVNMTFTNIDDPEDVRVLNRTVHFTEFTETPYSLKPVTETEQNVPTTQLGKRPTDNARHMMVDTDADNIPDSVMSIAAQTAPSSYHYYNGWVCPIGVYPPSSGCVRWYTLHEVPTHAHITLPGAPPNPCADQVGVKAGRVTISAIDSQPIGNIGITPIAYPCPQQAVLFEIANLREQFEQLDQDGRLIVSVDELIGEIIRKTDL
jgi:hypothetical protein